MKNSFKNINFIKVLRVALSSSLAILIAAALNLQYSSAAGIISFLSIQDTKKETQKDVIIRCMSYILSVSISFIVFKLLGYNAPAFGLFMFLLVAISYYLKWDGVLSSSAVVSTHFLMEKNHSPELILNELLLLFIGVGTTMIMNFLITNNTKVIKKDMLDIENELSNTFYALSEYVLTLDKSNCYMINPDMLNEHINNSLKRARSNKNNDFFSDSNYYISYMEARHQQYLALIRIIDSVYALTSVPFNSIGILGIMKHIGDTMHTHDNTLAILEDFAHLYKQFDDFPIPTTRKELENLSYTHDIIIELGYFIDTKRVFIQSLTEKQINRYWKEIEPYS